MLNEGKYAFDVKGGDMRLTMLRACLYPDPAPEAWVNIERKENKEKYGLNVPKYSQLGPFKCRYALLPHLGGALINSDGTPNATVKRKADEFNMPILVIPTERIQETQSTIPLLSESLIEILTPNVFLGTLKKEEWNNSGTIITRFVEGLGIPGSAKLKFNPKFAKRIATIKAVDLLERQVDKEFDWNKESGILMFKIGKFEILSFELTLSN
jgi:alpha-mannosidase